MPPKPKQQPKARPRPAEKSTKRTPVLEWIAAGLGLVLTLSVIGYLVREGVTEEPGPPVLTVSSTPAVRTGAGFVLPVTVKNAADQTAADVEVRGVLERPGEPPEERRATFAYVPGKGEAKGGLVFEGDPASGRLGLSAEGYAEP